MRHLVWAVADQGLAGMPNWTAHDAETAKAAAKMTTEIQYAPGSFDRSTRSLVVTGQREMALPVSSEITTAAPQAISDATSVAK
jgi:hypothetical protein